MGEHETRQSTARAEALAAAERETLYSALVAYGAPLLGHRQGGPGPLEELLLRALELARTDAIVFKVLPVVLLRNASKIDWSRLLELARARHQERSLGMLLELTGRLGGSEELIERSRGLAVVPTKAEYFFPARGRFEQELARRHTPEVAARWGFVLNMPEQSLLAAIQKHVG